MDLPPVTHAPVGVRLCPLYGHSSQAPFFSTAVVPSWFLGTCSTHTCLSLQAHVDWHTMKNYKGSLCTVEKCMD